MGRSGAFSVKVRNECVKEWGLQSENENENENENESENESENENESDAR